MPTGLQGSFLPEQQGGLYNPTSGFSLDSVVSDLIRTSTTTPAEPKLPALETPKYNMVEQYISPALMFLGFLANATSGNKFSRRTALPQYLQQTALLQGQKDAKLKQALEKFKVLSDLELDRATRASAGRQSSIYGLSTAAQVLSGEERAAEERTLKRELKAADIKAKENLEKMKADARKQIENEKRETELTLAEIRKGGVASIKPEKLISLARSMKTQNIKPFEVMMAVSMEAEQAGLPPQEVTRRSMAAFQEAIDAKNNTEVTVEDLEKTMTLLEESTKLTSGEKEHEKILQGEVDKLDKAENPAAAWAELEQSNPKQFKILKAFKERKSGDEKRKRIAAYNWGESSLLQPDLDSLK